MTLGWTACAMSKHGCCAGAGMLMLPHGSHLDPSCVSACLEGTWSAQNKTACCRLHYPLVPATAPVPVHPPQHPPTHPARHWARKLFEAWAPSRAPVFCFCFTSLTRSLRHPGPCTDREIKHAPPRVVVIHITTIQVERRPPYSARRAPSTILRHRPPAHSLQFHRS